MAEQRNAICKKTAMPYRYAEDKSQFFHFAWKPATTRVKDEPAMNPMIKQVMKELIKRQQSTQIPMPKLPPVKSITNSCTAIESAPSVVKSQQVPCILNTPSSLLYKMDIKFILN